MSHIWMSMSMCMCCSATQYQCICANACMCPFIRLCVQFVLKCVCVCMCVWIEWYRERHTRSLFQIPEHMKLSHEIEKEREWIEMKPLHWCIVCFALLLLSTKSTVEQIKDAIRQRHQHIKHINTTETDGENRLTFWEKWECTGEE